MNTPKDFLKESYAAKLSRPEWRTFAKSIRRDRHNACHCCRRSDTPTQVHHLFYDPGREPWEYDPIDVELLCEACHKAMHVELKNFRKHVFRYLTPQSFRVLNGAMAVALTTYDPVVFAHALAEFVSNRRLVENHAKAWGMPAERNTANYA